MKPQSLGALILAAVATWGTAAAEDVQTSPTYTRNADGRIETVTDAQGTTRYSYFPDGTIRSVVYPDGTHDAYEHDEIVAARRLADRLSAEDTDRPSRARVTASADPFGASHNRITFTGYYSDPETGLHFAGARYYDPAIGLFTTADPEFGDLHDPTTLNRYVYARDNPLRYVDRHGRQSGPPDDLYFNEQWLATLPPAKAAEIRAAQAQAETDLIGMMAGGGLALAKTVMGGLKAFGHLAYVGTFGPDAPGGQTSFKETQRNLESIEQFARHPWDTTPEAHQRGAEEAGRLLQEGHPVAAGEAFFAPLAAEYVTARAGAALLRPMPQPVAPDGYRLVPRGEPCNCDGTFTVTEDGLLVKEPVAVRGGSQGADGALRQTAPSGAAPHAARAERLAGSKLEHMNAAIAEQHGYAAAVERGHLGIQGPGKATARGPDYVTFDPRRGEIVVWDAKYRGPSGGSVPSTVSAAKIQRWTPEVKAAIEALPAGPAKAAAETALQAGRIRGEVFKWPQ